VVEARDLYARHTDPWDDNVFGLDMEPARLFVVNMWRRGLVTRENLLTEPQRWATLDYDVAEDPDVRAQMTWTVTRPGTGHGLALGFDRTLADQIYLSNAPDAPESIRPKHVYGTAFFPWTKPVGLTTGDRVVVDLEARLIRDDYIWSWKTRILDQGAPGGEKANFAQSTFLGMPLSPAQLRKRAASYIPTLNEDGRIVSFVLASMNEEVSVEEIARLMSTEFPARFPRPQDALGYVADLSRRYG
jgi:protein arginine N-methyltransferase 1